eukprot:1195044-Prorocentrum_minimum.AAC.2
MGTPGGVVWSGEDAHGPQHRQQTANRGVQYRGVKGGYAESAEGVPQKATTSQVWGAWAVSTGARGQAPLKGVGGDGIGAQAPEGSLSEGGRW